MPTKWLQERADGSKNGHGMPPKRAFCVEGSNAGWGRRGSDLRFRVSSFRFQVSGFGASGLRGSDRADGILILVLVRKLPDLIAASISTKRVSGNLRSIFQ